MWETDKREPDPDFLLLIADFFNVTTDYLLMGIKRRNGQIKNA